MLLVLLVLLVLLGRSWCATGAPCAPADRLLRRYNKMRADINTTQLGLEQASAALVAQLDKLALASASASAASAAAGGFGSAAQAAALKANLTAAYNANAAKVVSTWWTLPDKLVVKVRCCWCWCWCCCWCWCWRSCCYSCCCSC